MSAQPDPAGVGPIAYLTGEYPRATDTFIQREVAALRALGLEIVTFTIRPTDPAHHVGEEQRREAAATTAVLPLARNPLTLIAAHARALRRAPRRWLAALWLALRTAPPGLKGALWQAFYFAEAGVLADRLSAMGARHLHNHFGNSSCSVAMLAGAMADTPYSYTLHGPMELFEPMRWRIDEKIARARFVACISWFARSQGMLFSDPAHWDKLRIVHCGVTPALYAAPRPDARAGPDAKAAEATAADGAPARLLFVGRLAGIKGVPLLLEALARLIAQGRAATLTLVGDGPDRAALEAEADRRALPVVFTGYLSQSAVAERLAEADVFVLPSFAEGVPVVLMEALAGGAPVVASRVAGVPELVEDGVHGFLTPPGDVETLTERLGRLIDDPALRRRMGAAGRAKVAAEFDVAKEAAWLAALFTGAARGTPPPGVRPQT